MQKRYVVVYAECSDYDIDGFANNHSLLFEKAIIFCYSLVR